MKKGAPSTHLWVAFVSTVFRNTGREIAKGLLNQIQPVVISNEPACPSSGLTAQRATLRRSDPACFFQYFLPKGAKEKTFASPSKLFDRRFYKLETRSGGPRTRLS